MRKYRRVFKKNIPNWLWLFKAAGTHCMGFTPQVSWERLPSGGCQVTVQFSPLVPYVSVMDCFHPIKVKKFYTHQEMPLLTKLRLWWFWINSTEVKETDGASE